MVKRKKVKFALTKKQEQNLKRKYKIKSHLQRKPQHSTMYPLQVINKSSNSLF